MNTNGTPTRADVEVLRDEMKMVIRAHGLEQAMEDQRDMLIEAGCPDVVAANIVRLVVESIRVEYGIERAYSDDELRTILMLAKANDERATS